MAEKFKPQAHETTPEHRHEVKDVRSTGVIISMIMILVIIAVIHVLTAGMDYIFSKEHERNTAPGSPLRTVPVSFPAPRLQQSPASELDALLVDENTSATTYGWTDRQAGTVRIPIALAMDTVARRGLPPKTIDRTTTYTSNIPMDSGY